MLVVQNFVDHKGFGVDFGENGYNMKFVTELVILGCLGLGVTREVSEYHRVKS